MDIKKVVEKGNFDLHLHTTASDGKYSPSEVVQMAAEKGMNTIAITDHDTTKGIAEAINAGKAFGITVIPGIELSTKYKDKTIDILGYGINETPELSKVLERIREHRENRSEVIIKKFCDIGMVITSADVRKYSKGEVIARPHIAKAVVEKGYAKHTQEVFDLYLGDGKPCSEDKLKLSPLEGITLIQNAGGKAVLAHPRLVHDDHIIAELLKLPVDGIEVWHRKHDKNDVKRYKKMAGQYNKFITGGSDFHSDEHMIGEFGYHII